MRYLKTSLLFTRRMLREGKMPNVQKLIDAGACRDDLMLLGANPTPGLEPSTVHKCPLSTVGGQLPPGQWNTSVLMPAFAVTLKIGSAVKNADENASMVIYHCQ